MDGGIADPIAGSKIWRQKSKVCRVRQPGATVGVKPAMFVVKEPLSNYHYLALLFFVSFLLLFFFGCVLV